MRGEIRIVERRTGQAVATLEWDGTLWKGTGSWKADAATRKRLDSIVAARADLGRGTFGDMLRDGAGVRGWQGFSGWLQALNLALPAYGLEPDLATVVWPYERPEDAGAEESDEGDDDLQIVG